MAAPREREQLCFARVQERKTYQISAGADGRAVNRRSAASHETMAMSTRSDDDVKGPRGFTQAEMDRMADEMKSLHEQRDELEAELREQGPRRDAELAEAKRVHAESRAKAEELKSKMAAKLSEQTAAHDAQRRRDAETIAAMVKKQNENSDTIRRLEAELAALKAAAA